MIHQLRRSIPFEATPEAPPISILSRGPTATQGHHSKTSATAPAPLWLPMPAGIDMGRCHSGIWIPYRITMVYG